MAAAPGVRRSEIGDALRACRSAFIGVGVNELHDQPAVLTGSISAGDLRPGAAEPEPPTLSAWSFGRRIIHRARRADLIRGRIGSDRDLARRDPSMPVFRNVVRLPLMVGGRNEGLSRCAISTTSAHSLQHGTGLRLRLRGGYLDSVRLHSRSHDGWSRHHPVASHRHRFMSREPAREAWVWRRGATISPPPAGATPKCWCDGMSGRLTGLERANENTLRNHASSDVAGGPGRSPR